MTTENFVNWLEGFIELHGVSPTPLQWLIIKDHLKEVFKKETPERNKIANSAKEYCSHNSQIPTFMPYFTIDTGVLPSGSKFKYPIVDTGVVKYPVDFSPYLEGPEAVFDATLYSGKIKPLSGMPEDYIGSPGTC